MNHNVFLAFIAIILFSYEIQDSVVRNGFAEASYCPQGCYCGTIKINCLKLTSDIILISNRVREIVFKDVLACSKPIAQRLRQFAIKNDIRFIGRCERFNKFPPERLLEAISASYDASNQSLAKIQGKHRSKKAANGSIQSPYQFGVKSTHSTFCNFEKGFCGWNQLENIDFNDWIRSASEFSKYNFPDYTLGNASGHYIYPNILKRQGNYADLISSPLLLPETVKEVQVSLFYYIDRPNHQTFNIYVTYPLYSTTLYLITTIPKQNSRKIWQKLLIRFRPEHADYRILLRGIAINLYNSNIFIDDVSVYPIETDCYSDRGQGYRGKTSITKQGYSCQSWNSQNPHSHPYNSSLYTDDDLSSNYCRNPGGLRSAPWCYTTLSNLSWQSCNITACKRPKVNTPPYPLGSIYPIMIARKYYSVLNSGRVAIYHREQWGTICLNNKTSLVASVICRQANESEFGTVAMSDNPGRGQIWTSTRYFNCNPKASNLGQCHILSWGKNECTHSEDLWITCSRPSLMDPIVGTPQTHLTVSMRGGSKPEEGYVNIKINGRNGVICAVGWNNFAADVVCRQLGYLAASSSSVTLMNYVVPNSYISNLHCYGYETSLSQCSFNITMNGPTCSKSSIATLRCIRAGNEVSATECSDTATRCIFCDGFCKWTPMGNWSWLWLPSTGNHYIPSSVDRNIVGSLIYVIRPPKFTKPLEAILRSPVLKHDMKKPPFVQISFQVQNVLIDRIIVRYRQLYSAENHVLLDMLIINLELNKTINWQSHNFFAQEDFYVEVVGLATTSFRSSENSIFMLSKISINNAELVPDSARTGGIIAGCIGGLIFMLFITCAIIRTSKNKIYPTSKSIHRRKYRHRFPRRRSNISITSANQESVNYSNSGDTSIHEANNYNQSLALENGVSDKNNNPIFVCHENNIQLSSEGGSLR